MANIRVVIDWYRFSITIDKLIDIDCYRLVADFATFQNLPTEGIKIGAFKGGPNLNLREIYRGLKTGWIGEETPTDS